LERDRKAWTFPAPVIVAHVLKAEEIGQCPKLKSQGMEKFRKDLL
jgi:hypothetical protein